MAVSVRAYQVFALLVIGVSLLYVLSDGAVIPERLRGQVGGDPCWQCDDSGGFCFHDVASGTSCDDSAISSLDYCINEPAVLCDKAKCWSCNGSTHECELKPSVTTDCGGAGEFETKSACLSATACTEGGGGGEGCYACLDPMNPSCTHVPEYNQGKCGNEWLYWGTLADCQAEAQKDPIDSELHCTACWKCYDDESTCTPSAQNFSCGDEQLGTYESKDLCCATGCCTSDDSGGGTPGCYYCYHDESTDNCILDPSRTTEEDCGYFWGTAEECKNDVSFLCHGCWECGDNDECVYTPTGSGGCDRGVSQFTTKEDCILSTHCRAASKCGDGTIDNNESCDPANPGGNPNCREAGSTDECTYCGDDTRQPNSGEECDRQDDSACPNQCLSDCTCPGSDGDSGGDGDGDPDPACEDGTVNGSETCDPKASGAPAGCRAKGTTDACTYCGDNKKQSNSEDCDGTDDSACDGECQSDCTCPNTSAPDPACEDGTVNGSETCDPKASGAPAGCRAKGTTDECTYCGDNKKQANAGEECDGTDDSACEDKCQSDCTCPEEKKQSSSSQQSSSEGESPHCGDGIVQKDPGTCPDEQWESCPVETPCAPAYHLDNIYDVIEQGSYITAPGTGLGGMDKLTISACYNVDRSREKPFNTLSDTFIRLRNSNPLEAPCGYSFTFNPGLGGGSEDQHAHASPTIIPGCQSRDKMAAEPISAQSPGSLDRWVHGGGVYRKNGGSTLYQNGKAGEVIDRTDIDGVGPSGKSIPEGGGPLYIGGAPDNLNPGKNNYFPGRIADVRIYPCALTSTQFSALAECCPNDTCLDDLPEECDEGDKNSDKPGATCRTNCKKAGCGDGILDPGEECEIQDTDKGCSKDCKLPDEPKQQSSAAGPRSGICCIDGQCLLGTCTQTFADNDACEKQCGQQASSAASQTSAPASEKPPECKLIYHFDRILDVHEEGPLHVYDEELDGMEALTVMTCAYRFPESFTESFDPGTKRMLAKGFLNGNKESGEWSYVLDETYVLNEDQTLSARDPEFQMSNPGPSESARQTYIVSVKPGAPLPDGMEHWVHHAAVYNKEPSYLFREGEQYEEEYTSRTNAQHLSAIRSNPKTPLTIGGQVQSPSDPEYVTHPYPGHLAHVRVYDCALSEEEIRLLSTECDQLPIPEPPKEAPPEPRCGDGIVQEAITCEEDPLPALPPLPRAPSAPDTESPRSSGDTGAGDGPSGRTSGGDDTSSGDTPSGSESGEDEETPSRGSLSDSTSAVQTDCAPSYELDRVIHLDEEGPFQYTGENLDGSPAITVMACVDQAIPHIGGSNVSDERNTFYVLAKGYSNPRQMMDERSYSLHISRRENVDGYLLQTGMTFHVGRRDPSAGPRDTLYSLNGWSTEPQSLLEQSGIMHVAAVYDMYQSKIAGALYQNGKPLEVTDSASGYGNPHRPAPIVGNDSTPLTIGGIPGSFDWPGLRTLSHPATISNVKIFPCALPEKQIRELARGCTRESPLAKECYDSDGGDDKHTAGFVEWEGRASRDTCSNVSQLTEYYCYQSDPPQKLSKIHYCPDGCAQGACKQRGNVFGASLLGLSSCVPYPGEECDDGNTIDGDGCSATCTVERSSSAPSYDGPLCGNGIYDVGEQCDRGLNYCTKGRTCNEKDCTCYPDEVDESCGNRRLDFGEQCEKGIDFCSIGRRCNFRICTCVPEDSIEIPDSLAYVPEFAELEVSPVLKPSAPRLVLEPELLPAEKLVKPSVVELLPELEIPVTVEIPEPEESITPEPLVAGEFTPKKLVRRVQESQPELLFPESPMLKPITAPTLPSLESLSYPDQPAPTPISPILPLAQLAPLTTTQAPMGDTGPAAVAIAGAGLASGLAWVRRRKR